MPPTQIYKGRNAIFFGKFFFFEMFNKKRPIGSIFKFLIFFQEDPLNCLDEAST